MYTEIQKSEITQAVSRQMADTKVSQNKAAALIDISPAMLSLALNNDWKNIGDSTWRKLAAWAQYHRAKWTIRSTDNLQIIQNLCNDAQENFRTIAAIGNTGMGKTTGLLYYAKHTPQVHYILCKVAMGRKDFLNAILKAIGKNIEGSISMRIEEITSELLDQDNPLLIFDSAHKLNDSCFELLQQFTEALEHRCGIVIAGVPLLHRYITKMAGKGKRCFEELERRIGYWEFLRPVSKNVVRIIAADYGIEDGNSLQFLHRKCANYGTLRETMMNYSNAARKNPAVTNPFELLTSLHVGVNKREEVFA